ncbi:uncharacterized protein DUF4166 [Microcella putealis]|uniref:Uncharacterized protein DUF4166 n=1 Tax=Microcella putealis TaxID=337005 RepID=A0A4Q7LUJ2_9MICO|nr:DUF4166 domain-containing protein [Microcella putealis]RZS58835.1 uncharacterized protein DUF4166 [Microcella putealis]TQM23861.1 uncharacterized protein DUF4166 [Microcella putealis]
MTQRSPSAASSRRSAWEAALGDAVDRLHPRIREYVRPVPAGCVGRGSGTFTTAGCRRAWLTPAFWLAAYSGIAFPEFERDVPFTIENRADARGAIRASRTLGFSSRTRTMTDRVRPARGGGAIDAIGRGGCVETKLEAHVRDGALCLTSRDVRVRVASLWFAVPRALRPTITLVERWDDRVGRQHVDLRVALPRIGTVYGYAGHFDYRIERNETV